MRILFRKKFLKDLAKIPQADRVRIEDFCFNKIHLYADINYIPGVKKIKGFNEYYRVRFGDYRMGFSYRSDTLIFERVLHRKEIYKYFP